MLATSLSESTLQECLCVWQRCIEEAHKIFLDADMLLPPFAADSITEISETERGSKYLAALEEVYALVSLFPNFYMD